MVADAVEMSSSCRMPQGSYAVPAPSYKAEGGPVCHAPGRPHLQPQNFHCYPRALLWQLSGSWSVVVQLAAAVLVVAVVVAAAAAAAAVIAAAAAVSTSQQQMNHLLVHWQQELGCRHTALYRPTTHQSIRYMSQRVEGCTLVQTRDCSRTQCMCTTI